MKRATHFHILMTGRNVAAFVGKTLQSLVTQTYYDWSAVFLDDASEDGSADVARQTVAELGLQNKVSIIHAPQQRGKARAVYEYLLTRPYAEHEVCCMLDADDELAVDDALERLAPIYDQGFDVVWSDYVLGSGELRRNAPISLFRPVRDQKFVTSHLFTFRRNLFADVEASELQDDEGKWFMAACDVAIAFAALERSTRRYHLPVPLYRYNTENPNSHHQGHGTGKRYTSPVQSRNHFILSQRAPRALPFDEEFYMRNIGELFSYEFRGMNMEMQTQIAHHLETMRAELSSRLDEKNSVDTVARLLNLDPLQLPDLNQTDMPANVGYFAVQAIAQIHPKRVLVVGANFSTFVLAAALEKMSPGSQLIVVDGEERRIEAVKQQLASFGFGATAQFAMLPQAVREVNGASVPWYETAALASIAPIDILYMGAAHPQVPADMSWVLAASAQEIFPFMSPGGIAIITTPGQKSLQQLETYWRYADNKLQTQITAGSRQFMFVKGFSGQAQASHAAE